MNKQLVQLDCEDVVLMILEANERIHGRRSLDGITRLVKLVFLLEEETSFEGIAEIFPFKAHNYGPFSKEVYEAVKFLESCKLIEITKREYPSFYATEAEVYIARETGDAVESELADLENDIRTVKAQEVVFALTDDGRIVARELRKGTSRRRSKDIEELDQVIKNFGVLPLQGLIRYVYRRYPNMTGKSIHPIAKEVRKNK